MSTSEYAVVYNLREIYHEMGEYELKIVLDPKLFKNSHMSEIVMLDPDGKSMRYEVKKWGRKMNCVFHIDENVPDGVCTVCLTLKSEEGKMFTQRFSFWAIK